MIRPVETDTLLSNKLGELLRRGYVGLRFDQHGAVRLSDLLLTPVLRSVSMTTVLNLISNQKDLGVHNFQIRHTADNDVLVRSVTGCTVPGVNLDLPWPLQAVVDCSRPRSSARPVAPWNRPGCTDSGAGCDLSRLPVVDLVRPSSPRSRVQLDARTESRPNAEALWNVRRSSVRLTARS